MAGLIPKRPKSKPTSARQDTKEDEAFISGAALTTAQTVVKNSTKLPPKVELSHRKNFRFTDDEIQIIEDAKFRLMALSRKNGTALDLYDNELVRLAIRLLTNIPDQDLLEAAQELPRGQRGRS